jgi:DNA topoisomerase-1
VIVESPAKCKKIESYLGPGYKCIASYGHLRELKSLENIRRSDNYNIFFDNVDDSKKKKHIEFMRKDVLNAEEVILATDDDREGEAIAWHICKIFDLDPVSTKRIIFHEITENALQTAIMHPRTIKMNVVHAQQARQVLDLVVGFKVSPLLWKQISQTGLSAGRCQTPALRLVYDNQKEIEASPGNTVYTTIGYFANKCIPFELNKLFADEKEVQTFLQSSIPFSHLFSRSDLKRVLREPPEPLTTSRLQQVASNEMRISPKETMKICQTLYEAGYITYMRTDSKKYSPDFISSAKKYILITFGEEKYIHPEIDAHAVGSETKVSKKEKNPLKKDATPLPQEAHEAIRPTHIEIKDITDDLTAREKKMYKIIWENALESCMAAAIFYTFVASLTTCLQGLEYRSTQELVDFPGWKMIKGKFSTVNKEYSYLQQLKIGSVLPYKKITSKVGITGTKQHYTEAKLVQLLEENGIGRPSTFSTLIDKIQERGYVTKQDVPGRKVSCKDFALEEMKISEEVVEKEFGAEKGKLVVQPLGVLVINYLVQHFDSLFDYNYTKSMEDELDKISNGLVEPWYKPCEECWKQTETICDTLKKEKKQDIRIDENHVYLIAKYGPTIKYMNPDDGTVSFKRVKKDIDVEKLQQGLYKLEEILEDKTNVESIGEYQGHQLFVKKGKFGRYAEWGENKKSLAAFGNRPIENIEIEDIIAEIEKNGVPIDGQKSESNFVREISENISIRKGQYGDYIFYKSKKMKKPSFLKLDGCKLDYKTCNTHFIKDWIQEKYGVQ